MMMVDSSITDREITVKRIFYCLYSRVGFAQRDERELLKEERKKARIFGKKESIASTST
jgi:hypothetical protein